MEGEVTFFHDRKKYGFITPDDEEDDVFFHLSDLDDEEIKEGDRVEFETEQAEKGPRAINIVKL